MSTALGPVQARRLLLEFYRQGLQAVAGTERVRQHLASRTGEAEFAMVALGKAAAAMAAGAAQALGERLRSGLIITKRGHCDGVAGADWDCLESNHPVPGAASLASGQRLLRFLRQIPVQQELLFLLSGGASSLVEVLPPGISEEQLAKLNRWLLGSGLDINQVNRLRKQVSAIKAGRLIEQVGSRQVTQLLLSDVPGDDLGVIGSGPLIAHTAADIELPDVTCADWIQEMLSLSPALPGPGAFQQVQSHLLANSGMAVAAVAAAARSSGYPVIEERELLRGDAPGAGRAWAKRLKSMSPGILVQGGETIVTLPPEPGQGGRCQSLALAAALELADQPGCYLLAAGTDGSDGPGTDAGALVDGASIHRGELSDLDAADCLRRADAGSFLQASGDLLDTGPTGTNVMDLLIGLKTGR